MASALGRSDIIVPQTVILSEFSIHLKNNITLEPKAEFVKFVHGKGFAVSSADVHGLANGFPSMDKPIHKSKYEAILSKIQNKEINSTTDNENSIYIVKKDDTLSGIAKKFDLKLTDLITQNPDIKDPNKIYPGDLIATHVSSANSQQNLIQHTDVLKLLPINKLHVCIAQPDIISIPCIQDANKLPSPIPAPAHLLSKSGITINTSIGDASGTNLRNESSQLNSEMVTILSKNKIPLTHNKKFETNAFLKLSKTQGHTGTLKGVHSEVNYTEVILNQGVSYTLTPKITVFTALNHASRWHANGPHLKQGVLGEDIGEISQTIGGKYKHVFSNEFNLSSQLTTRFVRGWDNNNSNNKFTNNLRFRATETLSYSPKNYRKLKNSLEFIQEQRLDLTTKKNKILTSLSLNSDYTLPAKSLSIGMRYAYGFKGTLLTPDSGNLGIGNADKNSHYFGTNIKYTF
jgi:LysM repeat protein